MTTTDDETTLEPGNWVRVWGRVADGRHHPEDALVKMFSHSEEYHAHVRLDHIEVTEDVPAFVGQCTALHAASAFPGMYWRCDLLLEHPRLHTANGGSLTWGDDKTAGHIGES
jgi:hypothetical protein